MHGLLIVKSLLVRVFLLVHGLICAWRIVDINDNQYCWVILVGLGFLLMETGVVILYRHGREFQTVAFSLLFYLTCTAPSLWIIHVETANRKLYRLAENKFHSRTLSSSKQDSSSLIISTTTPLILSIEHIQCHDRAWQYTDDEHWLDGLQESLLIFLPLARLFLNHESITSDQSLIVFLVTLVNSVDLLSISHSLQNHDVIIERSWMYIGLIVLTINLFQMTFIDSYESKLLLGKHSRRKSEKIIGFFRSIFIHDGLFFFYRTFLTFKVRCSKSSIIFFMSKNLLMIIFYFYHICANSTRFNNETPSINNYEHFYHSPSLTPDLKSPSSLLRRSLSALQKYLPKTPRTIFSTSPSISYPFARRRDETGGGGARTAFALYGLPFRTPRIFSPISSSSSSSSLVHKAFVH